jgi:hypothetical protein
LQFDQVDAIADVYEISFSRTKLTSNNPGLYLKDERKIILDSSIAYSEYLIFTFFHELMHDRIEHDDTLLSLLADAFIKSQNDTIERLCNAGAAEILMPFDDIREVMQQEGFSAELIRNFCDRYTASSIAVAIQMVSAASHQCILVIGEPILNQTLSNLPMMNNVPIKSDTTRLFMSYTASSPSTKYSVKQGQAISSSHPIYKVWVENSGVATGRANLPFVSKRSWEVDFSALRFRNKVFTFFNINQPVPPQQMRLL